MDGARRLILLCCLSVAVRHLAKLLDAYFGSARPLARNQQIGDRCRFGRRFAGRSAIWLPTFSRELEDLDRTDGFIGIARPRAAYEEDGRKGSRHAKRV
jgi:hypothetical protein